MCLGSSCHTIPEGTGASRGLRLGGAVALALFSFVLIIAAGGGLFWNEGRAVQTARSLAEAGGVVVSIEAASIDPAKEGRLVHLTGPVDTAESVRDPDFGVSATALRLVRTAEMYQWKENEQTDLDDRYVTYSYSRVWSERAINSSGFARPNGHENPPKLHGDYQAVDDGASLGAFRPGAAVLQQLEATESLPLGAGLARAASERLNSPVQVVDGRFFVGQDSARPQIGDYRIGYRIAPAGPVSIIGRQTGDGFDPYQTEAGDKLLLVEPGTASAAEMLRSAETAETVLTWALRAAGLAAMALGFFLIMLPLAAVSNALPTLGTALRGGIGLVALTLTAVVAPAIMAVAWLSYRPLASALFVAVGLATAVALKMLASRRAAAAPLQMPGGEPAV